MHKSRYINYTIYIPVKKITKIIFRLNIKKLEEGILNKKPVDSHTPGNQLAFSGGKINLNFLLGLVDRGSLFSWFF